ncbi:MAG: hypothetical protein ACAH11_09815 [Sphingomonas sp.]
MKKVMMILAAAAAVGVAMPAMAQTYQRQASDGPSRAKFHGGGMYARIDFSAGSERADRFGDCMVAQDPVNSANYARAAEGSLAMLRAQKALAPAFETCRFHLQNWAYYDANAGLYHRRAIYWAVERASQPET